MRISKEQKKVLKGKTSVLHQECKNCLYYNVVKLGCKHPNWDNCIKRDKSGVVIDYLYHEYHFLLYCVYDD